MKEKAIQFILVLMLIGLNASFAQPNILKDNVTGESTIELIKFKENSNFMLEDFLHRNILSELGFGPMDNFETKNIISDQYGKNHIRLQQTFDGIPVEGGEYVLHEIRTSKKITNGNGNLILGLDINPNPTITEEEALMNAFTSVPAEKYAYEDDFQESLIRHISKNDLASYYPKGKLVIVSPDNSAMAETYRLAYKFDIYALKPHQRKHVFIDAHAGVTIKLNEKLFQCTAGHSHGSGIAKYIDSPVEFFTDSCGLSVYRLLDLTRGGGIQTYNANGLPAYVQIECTDLDNYWDENNQAACVAAHWASEQLYDFLMENYSWNSFDNNGSKMISFANYGTDFANAGSNGQFIFLGSGSGNIGPMVAAEIVFHEWMHGVIVHTSNLNYSKEPGALHETFCDVMAIAAEYSKHPNGGNWTMGEDVFALGEVFRDLADPKLKGNPDTYLGINWIPVEDCTPSITNDYCGIHNNGVVSHFAYILSEGKVGENDNGHLYNVAGIGIERMAELIFHLFTNHLVSTSDFWETHQLSYVAANELGFSSFETSQLEDAWCAIGLCTPSTGDSLIINYPNESELLQEEEIVQIEWESIGTIGTVNLDYSINNGITWFSIDENVPNIGSYFWTVPQVASNNCLVRIEDSNNPFTKDVSNTNFSIITCYSTASFISNGGDLCLGDVFIAFNTSTNSDFVQWSVNDQVQSTGQHEFNFPITIAGNYIFCIDIGFNNGCQDSYCEEIIVTNPSNGDFVAWASGSTIYANIPNVEADAIWTLDGQQIGFGNQLSYSINSTGTFELCMTYVDDCINIIEYCQSIEVSTAATCSGNSDEWTQYFNANPSINDIAEEGHFFWIATSIGLFKFNKLDSSFELFHPITTNLELPVPDIRSVVVDSVGNKWLATEIGLVMYNNTSWITYTQADFDWLLSSDITALEIDDQGNLWIGTQDAGAAKWGATEILTFNASNGLNTNQWITGFGFQNDSIAWISTHNTGITQILNGEIGIILEEDNGLADNFTREMINDNSGNLYVGSSGGINKIDVNGTISLIPPPLGQSDYSVTTMAMSSDGTIWIGDYSLFSYDPNGVWTKFHSLDFSIPAIGLQYAFIDSSDTLWCNYYYEFGNFDFSNDIWNITSLSNCPFKDDQIEDIEFSNDDNPIILGDYNDDLFELNDSNWISCAVPNFLIGGNYLAITDNGTKWVASQSSLRRINSFGVTTFSSSDMSLTSTIKDIVADGNDLWIRTSLKLIKYENGAFNPFDETNSPLTPDIRDIKLDSNVNLWVANASNGVLRFDGNNWTIFSGGPIWNGKINKIGFDVADNVYVSTQGGPPSFIGAMWSLDTINNTFSSFLELNQVAAGASPVSIEHDDFGNIWIPYADGSLSNGTLIKFNPPSNDINIYNNENSGILGSYISAVKILNETVYIGTDKGLSILNPSTDDINPFFEITNSSICTNTEVVFVNHSGANVDYLWKINNEVVSNNENFIYTFSSEGQYIITLVASYNDCEVEYSEVIEVFSNANELVIEDISECNGINSTVVVDAELNASSYSWINPEGIVLGNNRTQLLTQSGVYTLEVEDFCGSIFSQDFQVLIDDSCVFPCDMNGDQYCNFQDVPFLALAFGYSGPVRVNASTIWAAQPASPWAGSFSNGKNYKCADANGDGIVDLNDFQVILQNYYSGSIPSSEQALPSLINMIPVITQVPTIDNEGEMLIDILLEDENGNSVGNVYGVSFKVSYSIPNSSLASPPAFDFAGSSVGQFSEIIAVAKPILQGESEWGVAIARTDHQNISNVNSVARMKFIVNEDIVFIGDSLEFSINFSNPNLYSSDGTFIPMNESIRNFTIVNETVGVSLIEEKTQFQITPNPTSNIFTLEYENQSVDGGRYSLTSIDGKNIWTKSFTGKKINQSISIQDLPSGVYLICVTTNKESRTRRIVKQ